MKNLWRAAFILMIILQSSMMIHAQLGPKLIREEENEYGDHIVEWRYMRYAFVSSTPSIARPITSYEILKYQHGSYRRLDNEVVFASNLNEITQQVNAKLKGDYLQQQKSDPECFPGFVPVRLNEVDIWVDASNIYFGVIWDDEYLVDAFADCFLPRSEISFPFKEFEKYFAR